MYMYMYIYIYVYTLVSALKALAFFGQLVKIPRFPRGFLPQKMSARPLLQPELVKDLTRHMIFCVACGVVPAVPRNL